MSSKQAVPNVNLRQFEKDSELIWLVNNVRLPKNIKWEFEDRPWQVDIIEDKSKTIVVRKPTQIGMSTVFLGKMLYFADMNQCRLMYTLPRGDDVSDMVHSRLQEVITESPYIRDKMGEIDNVRMKRFNKSWIHFSEMSVPPRMMDVDWMINDEVDLSNQEHLEQAASRMDASKFNYRHRISTPTIENYGIDAVFQLSDKKHWVVKCPYCSHEQVMDWANNVVEHRGTISYVCARCHNAIHSDDIREGRWVPFGNTSSDLSGYQISHLMVPYIKPSKLWIEAKTMSTKNFYNFRLGLPYTPSTGSITRDILMSNCLNSAHGREIMGKTSGLRYVIGADQGNTITYSVGRVMDDGTIQIVLLGEISFDNGFEEFGKLLTRFGVKKAVLDALPNHHSASKVAENSFGKVSIAYFTGINDTYRVADNNRVNINKTDAYDSLVAQIVSGKIQFYIDDGKLDYWTERAMDHLGNMRRDVVQSMSRFGEKTSSNLWRNTGPDHFADAILYMHIAAEMATGEITALTVVDMSDSEIVRYYSNSIDIYDDETVLRSREEELMHRRGFIADLSTESSVKLTNTELVPDNPYKLLRQKIQGQYYEDDAIKNKG